MNCLINQLYFDYIFLSFHKVRKKFLKSLVKWSNNLKCKFHIKGGIFIESHDLKTIQIQQLDKLIMELRIILNEICINSEGVENSKERLIISECLDDLIVEYMKISIKH